MLKYYSILKKGEKVNNMQLEFNLESEVQFLGLFGLHISPLDFKNMWIIQDKNLRYRGSIKKEIVKRKNGAYVQAYHMNVFDKSFSCNSIRFSDEADFTFKIKLFDHENFTIDVFLGDYSSLILKNADQEIGHLRVRDTSIDLSYNLVTPEYNVKKTVLINDEDPSYDGIKGQKAYCYRIDYAPRTGSLAKAGFYQQVCGVKAGEEHVRVLLQEKNPNIIDNCNETAIIKGSVEQLFRDRDGIKALKFFREVVKNYCPFVEDVVRIMVDNSNLGQSLGAFEDKKWFFFKK